MGGGGGGGGGDMAYIDRVPRDHLSATSYVYDIPLGDFIGSTLSMAFQCIFSLPSLHSLHQV